MATVSGQLLNSAHKNIVNHLFYFLAKTSRVELSRLGKFLDLTWVGVDSACSRYGDMFVDSLYNTVCTRR